MRNVTRPVSAILNNRFELDDYGTSVELDHMPEIGAMSRISITNLTATDDEEMANVHRRFTDDVMGEPRFNGIRFDAAEGHPIEDMALDGCATYAPADVRVDGEPLALCGPCRDPSIRASLIQDQ